MQITTSQILKKYKIDRQKLYKASKDGLRFKKKIIHGRAVNIYNEGNIVKFFRIGFDKRNIVRS